MKLRPDFDSSPSSPTTKAPLTSSAGRGEFMWRGVRYLCVCLAGYLFGLAAGRVSQSAGPAWPLVCIVGALALVWVFRSGKKSNSHAASDAVAAAISSARATATASTTVQVAQGHIVSGDPGSGAPRAQYETPPAPVFRQVTGPAGEISFVEVSPWSAEAALTRTTDSREVEAFVSPPATDGTP